MSTLATLVYQVVQQPPLALFQIQDAMENIDLDFSAIAQVSGAVFLGDDTTIDTVNFLVIRTITFTISSATFQTQFPGDDNAAGVFENLYTTALCAGLGMPVVQESLTIS